MSTLNDSRFLSLPVEIRDHIYSYVLLGIGPSKHKTPHCGPAYYIHDFCTHSSQDALVRRRHPDIWNITARNHPLLYTNHQISNEGFDFFLANNEFIQDILVTSLASSACKFLNLFITGIGERKHAVRIMGLAIEDPDEERFAKLLDWLIMFANVEKIRTGVTVLRVKLQRPTKSPALFTPVGEAWSITPKDEDMMVFNIIVGDAKASWAEFDKSKKSDWEGRQRGTQRILNSCYDVGMESVKGRESPWREERRVWWEETWQTIHEKFQGWMEIMDDLKGPMVLWYGTLPQQLQSARGLRGMLLA
ncbi:hypothetical protein M436DRAFT_69337 [Aureobasidium namibiae CBS 147.97]|uniref:Uncharacterized protein n=1 Tax=Aureobasidium namibiae CBS 147.97 TaxID=1043004 RepID=A0A074X871_9PEZI